MHNDAVHDNVSEGVIALLQKLERWTGRWPRLWVIAGIVAFGALFTVMAVGIVWWAQTYRDQRAQQVDLAQVVQLMQERLDQRVWTLRRLTDWMAHRPEGASAEGLYQAEDVFFLGRQGEDALVRAQPEGLPTGSGPFLRACLERLDRAHPMDLCHVPVREQRVTVAWLVARVEGPQKGWLMMPLKAPDLAVDWDNGVDRLTQGRVSISSDLHTGPHMADIREADIHVLGQPLAVRLFTQPHALTWTDRLGRQGTLWVTLASGSLFTLAVLHAYLMLISTRRRARHMAREMSQALAHSQSRNQAVMNTAPDAIIITDGEGRVNWVNQAMTSLFGRASEDLEGQHIGLILPALADGPIEQWFQTRGYSNRVIGFESTGVRAEGTAFPVALSARRIEVNGELIQTFIVRDTTDAKWAEQELVLRDRALASSADGVVITSMTLPNQPIIYVNKAFEDITGYEASEVLGLNCKLLQREEVDQPGVKLIREAIREGRSCQVVLRNYRKDGTLFYNDLAISPVRSPEGVVTHYVGVQNDITERIAAEQVLQLRTERLNAVFELSPDGFVVFDKRGEVSIVNPSFERMTGLLAGDLVGQSRDAFEEVLQARCQASESDEVVVDEPDGALSGPTLLHLHTPTVRTLVRRIRRDGADNETVMYFRDITHEQEIDRMKSEFLAMAAHELRTPMVSIFGFTELLLQRDFNDARRKDMLGTIHKQAGILINLVNELLDLARIEARRGKDFMRRLQPIEPIIEQALGGLKMPGDERKVRVQLPQRKVLVWADTDKLGQAVLNVLSNAYKYSPQGGDIHLRVEADAAMQRVLIEVQDHGIGMTPEQLARVFERFFRADPSGNIPGTGLGMSLVKEIMQLHQGDVQVSSRFGEGTTVRLIVPAQVPPEIQGGAAKTKVCTD